jgi:demethylmenaquinone methyltransferase/2-methoxy-6-polyprenyl-1,4-benzoquinol methylase
MFDGIAHRYDFLNRVLSMGIDRIWRRATVRALSLPPDARVLDLATGTADVALEIARQHPDARIVGLDPSSKMLAIGRDKVAGRGLDAGIVLEEGDAQDLPYEDASFDACTIAFGIRNVPDRSRALAEMARVTRPGGRIAVLELGEPQGPILGRLARFHVRTVVPRLGALLSSSREYRYLQQSIAAFPSREEFAEQMRHAGLQVHETRPLTFGACTLFVASPVAEGEASARSVR